MPWLNKYVAHNSILKFHKYKTRGFDWHENDIVYGVFKDDICIYVCKTTNLQRIIDHSKYKDCIFKELKLGDKKLNWEKIYIQWYSLKYKLDNKDWNLGKDKVSKENKHRLLLDYYLPKYKKPLDLIILKYHLF